LESQEWEVSDDRRKRRLLARMAAMRAKIARSTHAFSILDIVS
jgi:hypothetical protein